MATLLKEAYFSQGSSASNFKIRLKYDYTQDKAANQTTITYYLEMQSYNNYSGSGSANTINGYIGKSSSDYSWTKAASSIGANSVLSLGSKSIIVTHNNDGTFPNTNYFAKITVAWNSLKYGEVSGTLTSSTIPTIPRYFSSTPELSCTTQDETAMNFSWSTSELCKKVILKYKLSTASSYSSSTIYDNSTGTTSGTGSLSGLEAGKTYDIYAICTKKDSSLDSNSNSLTPSTYSYPYIATIGTQQITIPAPGSTISQSLTLYNPLARSVTITTKINDTSIVGSSSTTTGTSVSLTLVANSMYTGIGSSATNGVITYTCSYTHDSTTTTTTATSTCITSATNCGPTVSANPTYTNTNATHTTLVGSNTIIQGQSSFSVTSPTITVRGGATVAKYYFKIGDGSYENNGTTATKTYTSTSLSGSVIAYCYAEDSRGYTSTVKQVTMRVLPYAAPSAVVTAERSGYTTNGSITVTATRSVLSKSTATSTDVNKWTNSISLTLISLSISPAEVQHLASDTIGGASASSTGTVSLSNLNLEKSYTLTIDISDKITTKTLTAIINKATPILSMNAVSSAVGVNVMVADNTTDKLTVNGSTNITGGNLSVSGNTTVGGTLDATGNTTIGGALSSTGNLSVGGNAAITGSLTIGGVSWLDLAWPIGSIYMSDSSTNPSTMFGGTWEIYSPTPYSNVYMWRRTA